MQVSKGAVLETKQLFLTSLLVISCTLVSYNPVSPRRQAPECVCADVNMVPDCRRQKESVCSPSPCLNNATCVSKGNDSLCR